MSHPVRFPPPPPTSNHLTGKQRAQLMRSSNKLGQVLGSIPHILDWTGPSTSSSVDILQRPSDTAPRRKSSEHRRAKSTPYAADENLHQGCNTHHTSSRPSTATSASARSHTSFTSRASSSSNKSEQSWRTPYDPLRRPPLLKLCPPESSGRCASQAASHSDAETEVDSPTAPSFAITSEATLRRTKMQRLTRKLGDGVPPELVFPSCPAPDAYADSDADDDTDSPLVATPASDERLPFSHPLPTIPEGSLSVTTRTAHRRHNSLAQPLPRRGGDECLAHRNAIYVIDNPDEHGTGETWGLMCVGVPPGRKVRDTAAEPLVHRGKEERVVSLGVSASAGPVGKGRSGRWVDGPVPLDQIAGPWHGLMW